MSEEPTPTASWIDRFEREGFAMLAGVATPDRIADLIEATRDYASGTHDGRLDRRGEVYGGRDLLWRNQEIGRLARSPASSARSGTTRRSATVPTRRASSCDGSASKPE